MNVVRDRPKVRNRDSSKKVTNNPLVRSSFPISSTKTYIIKPCGYKHITLHLHHIKGQIYLLYDHLLDQDIVFKLSYRQNVRYSRKNCGILKLNVVLIFLIIS